MFAIAAGLVLLGHWLIGRSDVNLGYDATFYVRMVEGPMDRVPSPFAFRVLVPWLARQLPVPAASALQIITYTSLFGCYVVVMASCRVLGLRLRDSIFGLAAIWGSTWHLYYFWNPYLTDGLGLLMLSAMMWAVLTGTLWIFAMASLVGVLAREGTAMLVPAWLVTRQWLVTIALAGGTFLVAALPHLWIAASPDPTFAPTTLAQNPSMITPLTLVRQVLATWGLVWLLALAGGAYLSPPHARRLGAVFAASLAGACLASVFATDLGRMFAFLAPVLAVGCAQLHAVLRLRQDTALSVSVTIALALQWVFNSPDVVLQSSSWLAGWPRRTFLVAELLLGLVIVTRLWFAKRVPITPNPVSAAPET